MVSQSYRRVTMLIGGTVSTIPAAGGQQNARQCRREFTQELCPQDNTAHSCHPNLVTFVNQILIIAALEERPGAPQSSRV